MSVKFSSSAREALSYSYEEAVKAGSTYIGIGHLLLGLIREDQHLFAGPLKEPALALPGLQQEIEKGIEREKEICRNSQGGSMVVKKVPLFSFFTASSGKLRLNRQAEKAIRNSVTPLKESESPTVEPGHLLLSILKIADPLWSPLVNAWFTPPRTY